MQRASVVLTGLTAITAFVAIVGLASACDSSLNLGEGLVDGEAGASPNDEGGAPTCASTCDRVIACGFGQADKREACVADCARTARAADLECVAKTACADMIRVCSGLPPDASFPNPFDLTPQQIEECRSACDRFQFFDCIDASELSTCRDLCESVPAAKRATFSSCASGAGSNCPKSRDCFAVLRE